MSIDFEYKKRIVAFLDIMGFKEHIDNGLKSRDMGVRSKYEWLNKYHNKTIDKVQVKK